MSVQNKPRIVIYGVGQFGQYNIRFAHQKGWPIVAAYNRPGDKVGKDIGQLADLGNDYGVIVQDCGTADYHNLEADIALVAITDRLTENLGAYERLMDAGLNIICHGVEAYYPYGANKELAEQIDYIARRNNVTFTGTGIWDTSRIWTGLLASGPCTEISGLFHKSTTDIARTGKELMLITGVGMSVTEFNDKIAGQPGKIGGLYKLVPHHVLAAMGYKVVESTERREPVVFDEAYYCPLLEKELPAGTVVGLRIVAEAKSAEGVDILMHHEGRLFKDGEVETTMWSVDGKPRTRIFIERDDTAHFTASCMFNRIKDVIAAPPGIQLVSELGPMKHTALD